MEWWLIVSLLFGGMVFLLLTNLPIAFAFLVVNMVAAYFFLGGMPGLVGVVTGTFTSITTFTLLPVPFFILMGELIFHSGLGLNAVNVLDKWLGNLRGRLSLLAIIMGVIIGALSGSTIATCALLGTILLPQMLEKGYSKNMSLGPLMGVGTVDALIPPNALTVVLASLANIDVGQLLIAGILPGMIMSGLYLVYGQARLLDATVPVYNLVVIAASLLIAGAIGWLLTRTAFGRIMRASADNREMAEALGVDMRRLYMRVFTLGTALGTLGGALVIPATAAMSEMGIELIVEAFAVVVIGGLGSMRGAFVGALIVGVLRAVAIAVYPELEMLLIYLIVIVVLLLRPRGLFGGAAA